MAGAGYKVFNAGDILTSSDVNTYLQQQVVMVFNNAAARTTALTSVLAEGMVTYLKDTNTVEVYDGSAWVSTTGDITGITAGTGITVTNPTSATPTVSIDTAVVPRLANANTFTTGTQTIQTGGTGNVGLIVQAHLAGGQTANLQEWKDSSGNNLARIGTDGAYRGPSVGSITPGLTAIQFNFDTNGVGVNTGAAAQKGLIVRGAASQTANLQEWQNSAGSILLRITEGGAIRSEINAVHSLGGAAVGGQVLTVNTNISTNIGIAVRGAASQTADLQQWQSSTGTVLAKINPTGFYFGPGLRDVNNNGAYINLTASGTILVGTQSTTIVPITVRAIASQTANLQEWQDSSGNVKAYIGATGGINNQNGGDTRLYNLGIGGSGSGISWLYVTPQNAAEKPVVIRGAASQTANLQEWQDSSGSAVAYVNSAGVGRFLIVQSTGAQVDLRSENGGGQVTITKQTAAASNPGSGNARLYFRDGTNAGTLKLVVRAGAAGAETTILDNIPQ